jgi:hypothetical protein
VVGSVGCEPDPTPVVEVAGGSVVDERAGAVVAAVLPRGEPDDVLECAELPDAQLVSTTDAMTAISEPIKVARLRRLLTTIAPLSL